MRAYIDRNLLPGLLRFSCFCSLLISTAFFTDLAITHGLRQISTSSFGVWNRIVDGRVNANILITGSSRAANHYEAKLIQELTGRRTYNIGLVGAQSDMQVARLRTYLAHNEKPRLVVHNLDLSSFQTSREEVYDPGQYIPYISEATIATPLSRVKSDFWKIRMIPLYGYIVEDLRLTWIRGILRVFGLEPKEDHELGFSPRNLGWTEDFVRFQRLNLAGFRVPIEAEGIAEIESLIALCQLQSVALVFVYSPEYQEMQQLTTNRREVFDKFRRLSTTYGVPFLDFSRSAISSKREYFYNSQHLNAAGASVFSSELAARLSTDLLPSTSAGQ